MSRAGDWLRLAGGTVLPRTVEVEGHRLWVPPGVLDPVLFRSGAWFAEVVAGRVGPGDRLLDLGCGSCVVGLLAHSRGARVVAADIDPRACRAARRNGLSDVREGDLFDPVVGERFRWVCMNPPYFLGVPGQGLRGRRLLARALYGGASLEVVRRFRDGARAHLEPGGQAVVVSSEQAGDALALFADWDLLDWTVVQNEGMRALSLRDG